MIIITYDKCTFSINNDIRRAWTRIEDIFLWLQGYEQGIMTSKFLLFFGLFNLAFLSPEKEIKELKNID